MTLVLSQKEIGEALIKYLAERGVTVTISQMSIGAERVLKGASNWVTEYQVTVKDVDLPHKEGPYR